MFPDFSFLFLDTSQLKSLARIALLGPKQAFLLATALDQVVPGQNNPGMTTVSLQEQPLSKLEVLDQRTDVLAKSGACREELDLLVIFNLCQDPSQMKS